MTIFFTITYWVSKHFGHFWDDIVGLHMTLDWAGFEKCPTLTPLGRWDWCLIACSIGMTWWCHFKDCRFVPTSWYDPVYKIYFFPETKHKHIQKKNHWKKTVTISCWSFTDVAQNSEVKKHRLQNKTQNVFKEISWRAGEEPRSVAPSDVRICWSETHG